MKMTTEEAMRLMNLLDEVGRWLGTLRGSGDVLPTMARKIADAMVLVSNRMDTPAESGTTLAANLAQLALQAVANLEKQRDVAQRAIDSMAARIRLYEAGATSQKQHAKAQEQHLTAARHGLKQEQAVSRALEAYLLSIDPFRPDNVRGIIERARASVKEPTPAAQPLQAAGVEAEYQRISRTDPAWWGADAGPAAKRPATD